MIGQIILGFGSNSGTRLRNIEVAVKHISLSNGINVLALSSIYETEPWGYKKQRNFLNCVGVFLCKIGPQELMKTINKIEKSLGRKNRGKWHAREIDIDILFYGKRMYKKNDLKIPHPFLHKRNFVLKPLSELVPGFIHPVLNKNIGYLYNHSDDSCKVKLYRNSI